MTTFCLMHSSGQGADGWKLLVEELEKRGYSAMTPAFHIDRTDEGASWHADTIVHALKDSGCEPAGVVCVAHSAAGLYLPLVAERWRPRRMVFFAAVLPKPPRSAVVRGRRMNILLILAVFLINVLTSACIAQTR